MATTEFQALRPAGWCTHCGTRLQEPGDFCPGCGTKVSVPSPVHHVTRGFTQAFGLHPAMALLTVVVNAMIFGDAILSVSTGIFMFGLSLAQLVAVSTGAGAVLGYITYRAQQKWYGDDPESAKIKALIVGFLTAIPAGLPGFLVIPSGIVGLFRRKS